MTVLLSLGLNPTTLSAEVEFIARPLNIFLQFLKVLYLMIDNESDAFIASKTFCPNPGASSNETLSSSSLVGVSSLLTCKPFNSSRAAGCTRRNAVPNGCLGSTGVDDFV